MGVEHDFKNIRIELFDRTLYKQGKASLYDGCLMVLQHVS